MVLILICSVLPLFVFYSRNIVPTVYIVSQGGQTALHCASSNGHRDIAQLLVDGGAQLDIKDNVSTELSRYM